MKNSAWPSEVAAWEPSTAPSTTAAPSSGASLVAAALSFVVLHLWLPRLLLQQILSLLALHSKGRG